MASEFLRRKAEASRREIDQEYGPSYYGGSEYVSQLPAAENRGGFSQGSGAGRAPAQRTVKSAPPAALPESKGKALTLPKAGERGFLAGGVSVEGSPFLYGSERAAAALLGAGEGVTDFIGSGFYKGVQGISSLGGLAPNPVSEWAGRNADAFLENSVTRDYEESIRERYRPSQGAENVTGIGQAIVQMLPGIGASKIVSAAGKGLNAAQAISRGENVGRALFGLQAAGNSASQAKAEGATSGQALAFGAASGALETAIEGIAGGIPGLGGGKVGQIAEAVKASPMVSRALDIAGEGGEEALSTVITPYLQRAIYDPDAPNATLGEIGQSALMGAVAAGVLQGGLELPGAISNAASDIRTTRRAIGSNGDIARRATANIQAGQNMARYSSGNPLAVTLPTVEEAKSGLFLPGSPVYQRNAVDNPSGAGYDGGNQTETGGVTYERGKETSASLEGVHGASLQAETPGSEETYRGRMGGVLEEGRRVQQPEAWAQGHIIRTPSAQAQNAASRAKQYSSDVFIVDDAALKARNPNAWAVTNGGKIYISDAVPAELADAVGYHECVHVLRQQDNEAYHGFLSDESHLLNRSSETAMDLLDLVVDARFPGKSIMDLTPEEAAIAYDELNALVWGYYKADPENARAQFSGAFQDYDAYIQELDAIMEGARQTAENQTGVGPAQAQGPESPAGAPAYRDVADNPLTTMLPTGEEALAGKRAYLPGSREYRGTASEGTKKTAPTEEAVNENGLTSLTERERINLSSGKKNKIVSTFKDAVSFVKNALINKQNTDRAYLGRVPDPVAQKIHEDTGLDLKGFGVMMNGDDVRHIMKNHGDAATERSRGQIAITPNDIARIPEILASPDRIYTSEEMDGKGRTAIIFEKQMGDYYITIQGISDGKQLLQTDTLYKRRTRTTRDTMLETQEGLAPVINAQGEPPQSSSNISILPGGQDVNLQQGDRGETQDTPREGPGPAFETGPESSVGAEYGPNTVGAAESRHPYRQKNSRVGTNTFSKMYRDLLNEIQADGGNITELPYDVVTEAQSLEHAQQRLFLDLEGEIADLPKREAWSGEDLDTAMGILDRYMEEARESRDYTKANEWARLIQSKGTTGGQMIQAFAKYSRTPQGILVNAVEALDRSRLTGGEKAQVLDHVQTQVEELDALRDGDKDSVIALIKENSRIRRTGSFFRNRIGRVLDRALQADSYDHLKRVAAAQVDSIAKDYQYKSRAEAAKNLRTMFMLSNLTTVLRNIVSNGVFGGLDSFAGSTAGVPLDILLSKRTGTRSVAAENPLSSQARKGMADGALKSYIEVALDADASGAENRYEHTSSRTFKMAGNPLERFFSTWDKYIGYALTTTDELAKGGVRAETQRGIDQLKERGLIRRMENGKWAADSSLDSRGEEMAKYRTFQDDTRLSRGLLTLRRGANQMIGVEGFGAGDLLAPFARVPANLVTRSVEYSPLGLANGAREVVDVLRKAHSGTLTAAEQARAVSDVSRGLTGSGLIAVFGALAAAGILRVAGNGEGEEDKTALETSEGITGTQLNLSAAMRWLSKGGPLNLLRRGDEPEPLEWQEGDTVISIGFLEPINAQMTTGALLAQELRDTPEAGLGQRLETYGRASLEGTLQSLLNLPAMSSLQDLANGYTYSEAETTGGRVADALISYGASQASSFIPNFMRAAARASDPYVRDTYSSGGITGDTIDSLKAGIPGLRQTLPIRKTPFGENRTYGDNQWLNAANALILPGGLTTYRTSDAAQELYRLPAVDGYPVYPARNAPGKVSYKGKEYELTAEQKSLWQTTYGQSYQRYIDELGGNAYYQSLPPEEKTKLVSGARSYASDLARRELIEGQGTQYQSSDWEKAYQAEQDGVPIDIWLSYRDVRNKLENSTDKTVSRNANQAVRQMIFEDQSLTKEQKATLDAYLFNDVTVIPKDIDVDYSSREAFQISQMSESAQERWPDIRDRFGLTPEEYQEALRIYNMDKDDGVNVSDKKRMLRERFGPSGNAIYTALGRKAE